MNSLSLERINAVSPYKVWGTTHDNEFNFITDGGVLYGVSFIEEMEIAGIQSYQFSFARLNAKHQGFDDAIRRTLTAIICEFFRSHNEIMIYICDTSDGKESFRSKLFVKWFESSDANMRFVIKTANTTLEGIGFYTAMIVERSNEHLAEIIEDFDNTAEVLCNK